MPISIELRHAALRLPCGRLLFENLSFTFQSGLTGLVGANGAGKSMLARMLAGEIAPASGAVRRQGTLLRVAQELAPAEADTVAALAGLGHLFDALNRVECGRIADGDIELLDGHWSLPAALRQALDDAGLPSLDAASPAAPLSGGERMRVALAGAFLSGADCLLLDEPTNHLDAEGRAWLAERLRQWPGGAIVVSHDRALLQLMERIVELDGHGLHSYGGNYSLYRAQREAEQAGATAALEHARKERGAGLRELRRQHDTQAARASRGARAGKDANMPKIAIGMMRNRAEGFAGRDAARRDAAREQLGEAVRTAAARVAPERPVALMLPETVVPAGRRVLDLQAAVPPWPADAPPLEFTLAGPVRLAISGPNGCGKSTLLRMLAGEIAPLSGTCRCDLPRAWLDQHASALLPPGRSVLERLRELDSPLPDGVLRSHLALLGLTAAQVQAPSEALSGGERLKAALACALWRAQAAQLLLLDEPTNHLDLASTEALEQALAEYPGAMAVVSHDRRFLAALAPTHALQWTGARWRLDEC
jgi:ATPase subunit of ABC transporter with duplicated ATPase domains